MFRKLEKFGWIITQSQFKKKYHSGLQVDFSQIDPVVDFAQKINIHGGT
jgi:hypothetical protein